MTKDAPRFTFVTESVEVKRGTDVTLICRATGSPMPYVRWQVGDRVLTPQESIPDGENIMIVYTGSQSATYTCVAESTLDLIHRDVEMKVVNGMF